MATLFRLKSEVFFPRGWRRNRRGKDVCRNVCYLLVHYERLMCLLPIWTTEKREDLRVLFEGVTILIILTPSDEMVNTTLNMDVLFDERTYILCVVVYTTCLWFGVVDSSWKGRHVIVTSSVSILASFDFV